MLKNDLVSRLMVMVIVVVVHVFLNAHLQEIIVSLVVVQTDIKE